MITPSDFLKGTSKPVLTPNELTRGGKTQKLAKIRAESPGYWSTLLKDVGLTAKATGETIVGDTMEMGRRLSEMNIPRALGQATVGLSAGMLAFSDKIISQFQDQVTQLARKGKIDWNANAALGEMRERLWHYEPDDPGAQAALAFVSAVPAGVKTAFDEAANILQGDNPPESSRSIMADGLRTAGSLAELAAFGKTFKTLGEGVKGAPKPELTVPSEYARQLSNIKAAGQEVAELPQRPLARQVEVENRLARVREIETSAGKPGPLESLSQAERVLAARRKIAEGEAELVRAQRPVPRVSAEGREVPQQQPAILPTQMAPSRKETAGEVALEDLKTELAGKKSDLVKAPLPEPRKSVEGPEPPERRQPLTAEQLSTQKPVDAAEVEALDDIRTFLGQKPKEKESKIPDVREFLEKTSKPAEAQRIIDSLPTQGPKPVFSGVTPAEFLKQKQAEGKVPPKSEGTVTVKEEEVSPYTEALLGREVGRPTTEMYSPEELKRAFLDATGGKDPVKMTKEERLKLLKQIGANRLKKSIATQRKKAPERYQSDPAIMERARVELEAYQAEEARVQRGGKPEPEWEGSGQDFWELVDDADSSALLDSLGFQKTLGKLAKEAAKLKVGLREYLVDHKEIPEKLAERMLTQYTKDVPTDTPEVIIARDYGYKNVSKAKEGHYILTWGKGKKLPITKLLDDNIQEIARVILDNPSKQGEKVLSWAKQILGERHLEVARKTTGKEASRLFDKHQKEIMKGAVSELKVVKKPPGSELTGPETNLDFLGLQTGFEKAAEFIKAVRENKRERVQLEVERYRQEFLKAVKGNPLDEAAQVILKGGPIEDYIKQMPNMGELRLSDIPDLKKGLALTGHKKRPAIRKSGFYATKEFSQGIKGYEDISKRSIQLADPTRGIQSIDQGHSDGIVSRNVLYPTRSTVLARNKWVVGEKQKLLKTIEDNSIDSGKKRRTLGDLLNVLTTADVKEKGIENNQNIKLLLSSYKQPQRLQLIQAARDMRLLLDDLLSSQNKARSVRKQEPIAMREAYLPWIRKTNIWNRLLGTTHDSSVKFMERPELPDFVRPEKKFNARELARWSMGNYPKIRDGVRLLSDYIETAGADIFNTNIIQNNKIHSHVLKSRGLENAAEFIDTWTAESYAGVKPRFSKWAAETFHPNIRRALFAVRRNLARAVFPLNFTWNVFIQTSSAGLTSTRYGVGNSFKGLKAFTDPALKQAIQQNAYSYILKTSRAGSPHLQDVGASLSKLKKLDVSTFERVEDYLNFMTTAVEEAATRHAVASAYYHGQKLGLKGRALWEYASDGGAKTQSMYNFEDLPGLLRAKEVTAVAPFQTFAMEVFNTIRELNIPGLRKLVGKTGAYETVSASSIGGKALLSKRLMTLARWAAAVTVTNAVVDKAIGRKPWEISSFVPFFGIIFGDFSFRGPIQNTYASEFKKGVRAALVYDNYAELRRWFLQYHTPAGVQLSRTIDGIEAVARGRMENVAGKKLFAIPHTTGEKIKAISMGPYRTEAGKKYVRERAERRGPVSSIIRLMETKKAEKRKIKGLSLIKGGRVE